jgi:hypothetical protein
LQRWYQDVLGFTEVIEEFELAEPPVRTVVLQAASGTRIELIERARSARIEVFADPMDTLRGQGYGHWALQVDDLDPVFSWLTGSGAEAVWPPAAAAPVVDLGSRPAGRSGWTTWGLILSRHAAVSQAGGRSGHALPGSDICLALYQLLSRQHGGPTCLRQALWCQIKAERLTWWRATLRGIRAASKGGGAWCRPGSPPLAGPGPSPQMASSSAWHVSAAKVASSASR